MKRFTTIVAKGSGSLLTSREEIAWNEQVANHESANYAIHLLNDHILIATRYAPEDVSVPYSAFTHTGDVLRNDLNLGVAIKSSSAKRDLFMALGGLAVGRITKGRQNES